MANPVFTELFAAHIGSLADPPVNLGGPAAGFRWVIVDVVVHNLNSDQLGGSDGWRLYDNDNRTITGGGSPWAISQEFWHWYGRQVLDNPKTMVFAFGGGPFDIRVSGYNLTLP